MKMERLKGWGKCKRKTNCHIQGNPTDQQSLLGEVQGYKYAQCVEVEHTPH
jgi:hypothetical protein